MSVVCFGEILWDMLPTGKQPGGAPFNVAVHLHQLGVPVRFISRVGADALGAELAAFVESKHLRDDLIQRDAANPTGVVNADVRNATEVVYEIVQPVAWDFLQLAPEAEAAVAESAAFVFGSLAARQDPTRQTLYHLLKSARYRVFDVNFRAPHYSRETTEYLLGHAQLVKMNEHELAEILTWYGADSADEAAAVQWLAARFDLQTVCVTLGADGALLWTGGQLYRAPGLRVPVQDTIGAGDAFLAGLLRGLLSGDTPESALRFACAAGAYVATQQGATPTLTQADVTALLASPANS